MPLKLGKENIGHNIKMEMEHGNKPHKQAIAIALEVAKRSSKRKKPKMKGGAK